MARRWLIAGLLLIVSACGGSAAASYDQSRSAQQIASDASAALKSAHSGHVVIQSTTQGSPVAADLDVENQNFSGKLSLGTGSFKMILVSGKAYIYGPDLVSFAHITDSNIAAALSARVGNKWVLLPGDSAANQQSLGVFSDFSGFADCVNSGKGLTKKGTSTIGVDSVVEVDDSAGGKIFVLTSSPHYPRRFVWAAGAKCLGTGSGGSGGTSTTPTEPGTMEFTKMGAHFGITAPSDTVDLASIGLGPTG
jgi:hypothetical protein